MVGKDERFLEGYTPIPYTLSADVVKRWQNKNVHLPQQQIIEKRQDGTYRWVYLIDGAVVSSHIISPVTAKHWITGIHWGEME